MQLFINLNATQSVSNFHSGLIVSYKKRIYILYKTSDFYEDFYPDCNI